MEVASPPTYSGCTTTAASIVTVVGPASSASTVHADLASRGYTIVRDGPYQYNDGTFDTTRFRILASLSTYP